MPARHRKRVSCSIFGAGGHLQNMNAQIENEDYVADFVEAAVRIAQTVDGVEERGEILSLATNIYAESGQLDLALSLADTIEDSYQRDLTLTNIATICAAAGDDDQADSLLEMIDDEVPYGLAIEQVAAAYTRSGEIDKAVETARRLNDSDSALSSIARACPSRDLLTDCLEIVRSIDYPELKATALIELAGKARQLEAQDESAELIEEAVAAADEIEFPQQRIEAWVRIAALYKDNDQTEQAAEVLSKARGDCEETEKSDRDAVLYQIAAAYAQLRDFETAEQLLEEIENPYDFCWATAAVALEHYQAADQTAANKLLADGLEVIKDEPVYGEQSLLRRRTVLANLAQTYAAIGHVEDALRVNELLDSEEQQDESLREIAYTLAPTENRSMTFKVFEKIKNDAMRVLCEVDVVRAWARSDQLELADHLLSNASAELAKVAWPQQRTKCLAELAQAYELREQPGRCSENLFEALTAAAMIKGSYLQARALLGLAVKHKELIRSASEAEQQILEGITDQLD
jgi:tetratricopeptide (TPR) repeat protein